MTRVKRKLSILLEVTVNSTKSSAGTYSSDKTLTSVVSRCVVVEVCADLDVDKSKVIRVDSTCEAPTDVWVIVLGRRLRQTRIKKTSTCNLPDEPYSFVIYGHKIIINVYSSDIGYMILRNECFLLDGGVFSECRPPRWKHAFYGMSSSGLISMRYALYVSLVLVQFLPLICGRLLPDLDSSHAFIVIIYSDPGQ